MPTYRHMLALRAAMDQEVVVLQRRLVDVVQTAPPPPKSEYVRRWGVGRPCTPIPPAQEIVMALDARIGRLEQLCDWIDEDEHLARFIDSVIGHQVRAAERRQARLSAGLNVLFMIAGWLLSLIGTPANLAQIVSH